MGTSAISFFSTYGHLSRVKGGSATIGREGKQSRTINWLSKWRTRAVFNYFHLTIDTFTPSCFYLTLCCNGRRHRLYDEKRIYSEKRTYDEELTVNTIVWACAKNQYTPFRHPAFIWFSLHLAMFNSILLLLYAFRHTLESIRYRNGPLK